MKTINAVTNGQFDTSQNFAGWALSFGPTLPTYWQSGKPANGSGGAISFPTFNSYTPIPYTPSATNAPAGNAVYIGWRLDRIGGATYSSTVEAGRTYTFSMSYAGNPAQSSLTWVIGVEISIAGEGNIGDMMTNGSTMLYQTFSPTGGWLQRTITFTPSISGSAGIVIRAIGTDGTITNGSTSIGGASVIAPVLIANLSLTTPSTGRRAYPVGDAPAGGSTGTFAAGNDPRIPNRSVIGLWHPRTERIDLTVPGSLSIGSAGPGVAMPAGTIRQIYARVGSKSTGASDQIVVDVTLGGTSIFASAADQCTITSSSVSDPGVFKTVSSFASSATVLGLNITSVVGTASDLAVSVWIEVT